MWTTATLLIDRRGLAQTIEGDNQLIENIPTKDYFGRRFIGDGINAVYGVWPDDYGNAEESNPIPAAIHSPHDPRIDAARTDGDENVQWNHGGIGPGIDQSRQGIDPSSGGAGHRNLGFWESRSRIGLVVGKGNAHDVGTS